MAERWKWGENAAELNEVERLKLRKDGLDVIQDITGMRSWDTSRSPRRILPG